MGLAFFLDDKTPGEFGYNGADEGFQADLTMNSDETGRGISPSWGTPISFLYFAPYVGGNAIRKSRGRKFTDEPQSANGAIAPDVCHERDSRPLWILMAG